MSLPVSQREMDDLFEPDRQPDPESEAERKRADLLNKLDPTLAHRRILVAEDTRTNQFLIRRVLEEAGAEVTIVEDGRRAVDAAMAGGIAHKPFDAVVLDMHMPVMDGYEAAGLLRREKHLPLIALTASAMEGDRERCLKAGCHGYVTKPIDRAELVRVIGRLIVAESSRAHHEPG